jgi:hypothetical protein
MNIFRKIRTSIRFGYFIIKFSINATIILKNLQKTHLACSDLMDIIGIEEIESLPLIENTNTNIKNNPEKGKLYIFNHVNMMDGIVVMSLFKNPPSMLAFGENLKIFPLNILSKKMKIINVSKSEKLGNVQKIIATLESGQDVVMAPDSCAEIPQGNTIAPFKSGAFVLDYPVTPIVINYFPSSPLTSVFQFDRGFGQFFCNFFNDGNVKIFVTQMETQYMPKNMTTDQWKNDVHAKMSHTYRQISDKYKNFY